MRWFIAISYLLLWVVFIAFTIIMTPYWGSIVMMPVFILVALCVWLYGKEIGYLFVLLGTCHNYILTSLIYGDLHIYYQNRLTGTFLGIVIVFLIGNIRDNYRALRIANNNLDQRVTERNAELDHLTAKLITDVEATRIRHGQTLHDGIGQQLTGIQLYCSSLTEQMVENSNPIVSLVISLRTRAEKAHHMVRKTARLLFPVRMNETGLAPAIAELASCLNEMEHLSVDIAVQGDLDHVPDALSLALYRICHESALCAATGLEASVIQMTIDSKDADCRVTVQHNGTSWSLLKNNMEQRLILYRLNSLGGLCSVDQSAGKTETITYRIPGTA